MKHSRFIVWLGAASALFIMTIAAVVFGSIFQYLPVYVTQYLAGIVFFIFAFKLLRDAKNMKGGEAKDELREVEQQLFETEAKKHLSNNNKEHDIELGNRPKNKNLEIATSPIININSDNSNNKNVHNNNDILQADDQYVENNDINDDDDPKGKKRLQRTNIWDFFHFNTCICDDICFRNW